MPEHQTSTVKSLGGESRELAQQGASFAKDVSEKTKATTEETNSL
jgi:hypothetical protein